MNLRDFSWSKSNVKQFSSLSRRRASSAGSSSSSSTKSGHSSRHPSTDRNYRIYYKSKNATYRQALKKSSRGHQSGRSSRQDVQSRMADFFGTMYGGKDPDGFVRRSKDEDCLKCMLKIPHTKCESHKYIRVGGGYRHSYLYVKMILDEIEFKRQQELLLKRRLEAINEGNVRAIRTWIRTKSGRLVERIIYMTEEDYQAFQDMLARGEDPSSLLKSYLNKDEADMLESYDMDEQVAIKTYIRTKSGRLIEKIVYVSKREYEAMQRGELDMNDVLRKHLDLKDGETLEGYEKAKMRVITTYIRTKSGRLIEKKIMISEEDYQKLQAGGNLNDIIGKYVKLADGEKPVGWQKPKPAAMKQIKTWVRTKSGRLVEKIIYMTEEEYKEFMKSGGDPNFLKKFLKLKPGEEIDRWEKASTIYGGDSDDEQLQNAKAGDRLVDKDGNVYEVVIDPLTGKKYKKIISKGGDANAIGYRTKDGKLITEADIKKRNDMKKGKRNKDSDSEYSYRSFISEGGTRHVRRRKKLPGGGRARSESYHSSQDADGEARRRKRRRDRKHGDDSDHSYYSVVSAGGTRHVRRRKRNADGTRGDSESYHSDDSAIYNKAAKEIARQKAKMKERVHGSDSEHSYYSEVSAGGTRRRLRRKRLRDEHGNIIGYGKEEVYDSDEEVMKKLQAEQKKKRKGRQHGSDSDYSYYSEVSAGGTHHRKRRLRLRDKDGKVIGYGKPMDYSSSDSENERRKKKKKKHGSDSDYSYYSEVSAGGTRRQKRRLRIRDKDGKIIGHGDAEDYSSSGESFISVSDGKGGRMKIPNPNKKRRKTSDFSDCTTDSEVVREKLKNMTKEEREAYLKEREARAKEREAKRREKYGDKYEEMMEKHKKKKEEYKSMVTMGKGKDRFKDGDPDDRGIGLAHDDLGKKKGGKKDGNEAGSEDEGGKITLANQKKKKRRDSSASSYEVIRDKDGNIIKKIKKDKDGNLWEYEYDKDGNIISKKKKGAVADEPDDGDYFEVGPDGKIRLKAGKKKIDLSKLSREDLIKLGIDPNLSKAEILRLLKEKFGEDIDIVYDGKKIGLKHIDDYDSDVKTDDLVNDSDLDLDTLRGARKLKVVMKRGGQKLQDHIRKLVQESQFKEVTHPDEKNSAVDFLSAYRLVDPKNLEVYAKSFAVEDYDNMDGLINYRGAKMAVETVPQLSKMTTKQIDFVFQALDIDPNTELNFRMFAVVAALSERVTKLDQYCLDLIAISNLIDMERKLKLYRHIFYCNTSSDRDPNYIKLESLKIELMAGGLNWEQQQFVMSKLQPNDYFEISFLDFLCYIPLFLSFHENIVSNPLDIGQDKYDPTRKRRPSIQRDMNPLGYGLSRETQFYKSTYMQDANDRETAKHGAMGVGSAGGTDISDEAMMHTKEKQSFSKFPIIPKIPGASYPSTPKHKNRSISRES